MFPIGQAVSAVPFTPVNRLTGEGITTGTWTAFITRDGSAQTALAGTAVYEGNNQWSFPLTDAEMNGKLIGVVLVHDDATNVYVTISTWSPDRPTFLTSDDVVGFPFGLIARTDGQPITSGAVTAFATRDGIQMTLAGTPVHIGNGQWIVNISSSEMQANVIGLTFIHADGLSETFSLNTWSPEDVEEALLPLPGDLDFTYYGTLREANEYFSMRLHEYAWSDAPIQDRPKALWAATQIIDNLRFKGYKRPLYELLSANNLTDLPISLSNTSSPTIAEVQAAEASQEREFPRGTDTAVPDSIRIACYEIAHTLLDGKDPELELENLGVISQGYASVRTTYSRTHIPVEHLVNGIPSSMAWRILLPFLRDDDAIKISRVS